MLMLKTATVLEVISKRRRTARPAAHAGLAKNTIFAATHSAEDSLVLLDATADGLTAGQAAERLDAAGPNTIEAPTKTLARRIADAFIDPFAGILAALALVSLYIDVLAVPEPQRDPSTVIVIGIMLLVSGGMKFIQEARSGNAAEALKDLVSNTCTALRDGERIEIPFDELVPGDVIRLSAGDMVPADARIITARDLFVIESALTGESEAVEKTAVATVVEGADMTPSAVAPDSMLGQSLRDRYAKVDEVPFNFSRRRLSVVVADAQGKTQMVTKGAAEEMLEICSYVEVDGTAQPLTDEKLAQIRKQVADLNAEGLRVIAVAQKTNPRTVGEFDIADECDMVLMGFLAFLDPPKASAAGAVATLEAKGVAVKVLTGDNDRVAATVCEQIGIDASNVLLGSEIDALDDAELAERAEQTHLFAKLSPLQKARLVRVMRELLGHTVGFMGDGINDAAAMRASDCGISVDSAVDIAKESADIILLQKDLGVIERGIIEGRRTYGNLLKYLKTTVSSNFGNVLSVTVASLFLPFLPMSALQLVLLSLVYEIVCIALPWDTVDDAWTARPRAWDAASIKGFMLELGPVSSLFDIVTFAALFFAVCPATVGASWAELAAAGNVAGMAAFAAIFQSGWFVESMWSQTLVIHMLRSPHLPSPRDHAAPALCVLTVLGLTLVTWLPASPIAEALGLMPLPASFFTLLIGIVAAYIALTQLTKRRFIARHAELL